MTRNWTLVSDCNPRSARSFESFATLLDRAYEELAAGSCVTLSVGPDNAVCDLTHVEHFGQTELKRFVSIYGRRA